MTAGIDCGPIAEHEPPPFINTLTTMLVGLSPATKPAHGVICPVPDHQRPRLSPACSPLVLGARRTHQQVQPAARFSMPQILRSSVAKPKQWTGIVAPLYDIKNTTNLDG